MTKTIHGLIKRLKRTPITIHQYYPGFIEGEVIEQATVYTKKEFRAIPFIKRRLDNKDCCLRISPDQGQPALMAVYSDSYWVIAFIYGDWRRLKLPKWNPRFPYRDETKPKEERHS